MHDSVPTGTCVCLLKQENRCCYANIGASGHFDINRLKETLPNLLQSPDDCRAKKQMIYIEGFFVTENRFPLCIYINELRGHHPSLLLSCNLSAKYLIDQCPEEIKYLAENATVVFGNLGEFKKLTEKYDFEKVEELFAHLLKPKNNEVNCGRKVIICTNGSNSVFYATRLENDGSHIKREFRFEPVPVDEIVDTTACGDAFVAGFFFGYLRNHSIEFCIRKGVEVASKKLRNIGGVIS